MSKLNESRTESTRDDFETPEKVLVRVREVFDKRIDLDPCTKPSNPTKARYYLAEEGGLDEWPCYESDARTAFVNSPYGSALKRWVRHCIKQANLGWSVVMLTPARPDTAWYDELVTAADCFAQIRGRLTFNLDGQPVKTLDKKASEKAGREVWRVTPAQFPCTLTLLDPFGQLGQGGESSAQRFARVMSRDRFARIEQVLI